MTTPETVVSTDYQTLDELTFVAAGPDDKDTLTVPETDDPSQFQSWLREQALGKFWWLQKEWQEKGLPKEQITWKTPFGEVNLYNFFEVLTEEQVENLGEILSIFLKIEDGKALSRIKYILVNNTSRVNPNTGRAEDANGYYLGMSRAVELYPRAMDSNISHRVQGVRNDRGTLTHELTHSVESGSFEARWRDKYGWERLPVPTVLPGGSYVYEVCHQPERCVSAYAATRLSDDICDSMVAAVDNPEVLDPGKLADLEERYKVFEAVRDKQLLPFQKKKGKDIVLPRVNSAVKYKTLKMKIG